ncbi:glycosyltransferase, partial [Nonomuraea diastatica]
SLTPSRTTPVLRREVFHMGKIAIRASIALLAAGAFTTVAAALVMPSRWEGQPLTLRESLMAGTPAIASNVGGIPEILGKAGILVAYGDVEGLRRAVRKLLAEPGAAEMLAAEAERRGREMPGEDDAVRSVLSLYGGEDPMDG